MDLTKFQNIEKDNLKIDNTEFTKIKTFIETSSTAAEPADDPELLKAINSMLNRWNIPSGKDRDDLVILCKKLYYERLKTGNSRIFWQLLKENIENITSLVIAKK